MKRWDIHDYAFMAMILMMTVVWAWIVWQVEI